MSASCNFVDHMGVRLNFMVRVLHEGVSPVKFFTLRSMQVLVVIIPFRQ